jgi:hypothetical protein
MIVTALNKMSHSEKRELQWAGVLVQTTQLPKDARVAANASATEAFLTGLGELRDRVPDRATSIWREVAAARVAGFIEGLQFPAESARASGRQLAAFIRQQALKTPAELTTWTVALVSVTQAPAAERRHFAGREIGLVERNPANQDMTSFALKKANILNPKDEALDFAGVTFDAAWLAGIADKPDLADDLDWLRTQQDKDAGEVALDLTRRWQRSDPPKINRSPEGGEADRANGRVLRVLRRRTHGLLLIYPVLPPRDVEDGQGHKEPTGLASDGSPVIGLALSFPTSDTVLGVEYRVNKVWDAEVQEDAEYDD